LHPKQLVIFSFLLLASCNEPKSNTEPHSDISDINCNNNSCHGTYHGPEFINGSDVAHQHSNKMSAAVGDKLKELYKKRKYSKVDFANIEMTTEGMGSGTVSYALKIPFIQVDSKCKAYTSFDHVGGWNHAPELEKRTRQLSKVLMKDDFLFSSHLKRTKEGLQEHWIQWRNKEIQKECELIRQTK